VVKWLAPNAAFRLHYNAFVDVDTSMAHTLKKKFWSIMNSYKKTPWSYTDSRAGFHVP